MTIQERMVARSEREKDLLKYGRSQERERIIKLLEDKQSENCKYMDCSLDPLSVKLGEEDGHDFECGSWTTHQTIALIKGEK